MFGSSVGMELRDILGGKGSTSKGFVFFRLGVFVYSSFYVYFVLDWVME